MIVKKLETGNVIHMPHFDFLNEKTFKRYEADCILKEYDFLLEPMSAGILVKEVYDEQNEQAFSYEVWAYENAFDIIEFSVNDKFEWITYMEKRKFIVSYPLSYFKKPTDYEDKFSKISKFIGDDLPNHCCLLTNRVIVNTETLRWIIGNTYQLNNSITITLDYESIVASGYRAIIQNLPKEISPKIVGILTDTDRVKLSLSPTAQKIYNLIVNHQNEKLNRAQIGAKLNKGVTDNNRTANSTIGQATRDLEQCKENLPLGLSVEKMGKDNYYWVELTHT